MSVLGYVVGERETDPAQVVAHPACLVQVGFWNHPGGKAGNVGADEVVQLVFSAALPSMQVSYIRMGLRGWKNARLEPGLYLVTQFLGIWMLRRSSPAVIID